MLALIFRGVADYTTGFAFKRALEYLGVPFVHLDNNQIWHNYVNLNDFDSAICVDDGFGLAPATLPNMPERSAYYAIYFHVQTDGYLPYLHQFGKIYCAQYTYGVKLIQDSGIMPHCLTVEYLPLAYDSLDMPYKEQVRDIPISFVCSRTTERRWYLTEIVKHRYGGFTDNVFHQELGDVYQRSKVGLNDYGGVGHNVNERDINIRVYETLGNGALLLQKAFDFPDAEMIGLKAAGAWFRNVNHHTGEHFWDRELIPDGANYVSWRDASSLLFTLDYYLSDEGSEERKAIAERGRQWALQNTYVDRVKVILDGLGIRY